MKNAIILHGTDDTRADVLEYKDSMSNAHWYPWLQRELIRNDILAQTPEMPHPWDSAVNYNEWKNVFQQFSLDENSILIGHSAGAGFVLKYLSLNKKLKISRLILVAPWIDTQNRVPGFVNDLILDKKLLDRVGRTDLFLSDDDMNSIKLSVDKIEKVYGDKIIYHRFTDKGHFVSKVGKEFPELLDIIIKK